ncbi:MAG: DNA modification methylase [Oscillospiraceae bacterium]|jgi:DNA modification methylase|nr:DNA modification methylase [Oscillospiraceae bacterium]
MEIIVKKLSELNPAAYNPRKALSPGDAEYEQIKNSILRFGMVEPIVWNRRTGNVVGGHQRLTVLRHLGHETVEVSAIDVPEAQEKALNVALNKISGEWDEEKLAALLDELSADADEALLSLTGFAEEELAEILAAGNVFSPPEDSGLTEDAGFDVETALEDVSGTPVARRGDIFIFGGKHRLMCGDATDAPDMTRLMDGKTARLTVTDPPYNVDYEGKAGKMLGDRQSGGDFLSFLSGAFQNINTASAAGAAVYVFHADSEGLRFRQAFEDAGFKVRQCLVWVKNAFVMGRQDYQWRHEPILYGWKGGHAHFFTDDRTQTTVIEHDRPLISKEHPTMKPVSLVARLIENSSKEGWIVLDPFGGSGSTLIAADKLARRCFMMERDAKYCDVIARRYIEQTGGSVTVVRDGAEFAYPATVAPN